MRTRISALCVLAALLAAPAATASTFSFDQGGFAEGATLSGTFTGVDLNGDQQLSLFRGEISAFSLSFSGNSLIPAFEFGLADLFVLVADLDGTGLIGDGLDGDVEGIGAEAGPYRYLAGPGPVDLCGLGNTCAVLEGPGAVADFSTEPIAFRVVPLPAGLPLMLVALAALAGFRQPAGR